MSTLLRLRNVLLLLLVMICFMFSLPVPVANKRDTRSIEEAMNEIRAKKRQKQEDETAAHSSSSWDAIFFCLYLSFMCVHTMWNNIFPLNDQISCTLHLHSMTLVESSVYTSLCAETSVGVFGWAVVCVYIVYRIRKVSPFNVSRQCLEPDVLSHQFERKCFGKNIFFGQVWTGQAGQHLKAVCSANYALKGCIESVQNVFKMGTACFINL